MKFVEVKVDELPAFVAGPEYHSLDIKPISPERAISQWNNPFAKPDDVALIYAHRGNNLLGFVGLLPDKLNHHHGRASSNTGWWIKSPEGKTIGLPLFMRAYQACGQRLFFTDCTEYTRKILEKTGHFTFHPPQTGKRWFIRFYTKTLLKNKNKLPMMTGLAGAFDRSINSIREPFLQFNLRKKLATNYSINEIKIPDCRLADFIANNSFHYFLGQDIQKLIWIREYPWLNTKPETDAASYPFSRYAKQFSQSIFVVERNNNIEAVALLSIRDNHASLPFFYSTNPLPGEAASVLAAYIIQQKVNSLLVFNRELISAFDNSGIPAYHTSKIIRHTGYSKTLENAFSSGDIFQDGEGDIAFT